MSLHALRDMARSNRGGGGAETLAGLDDATDELARELTESRERLERELARPAGARAISDDELTAWYREREAVYGVPGPQTPPSPPVPEPAPAAPAGAGQPLIRMREGRKMTLGDQTKALAGQTWRQVRRNLREMRKHPGGMINGWLASPGPSVDDQIAYKREKRWVPLGCDDGVADKAGTLHQDLIGVPGVAFFGACKAICARPFRFWSAFFACYLITAFTLIIVQPRIVGVAMLIGLPIGLIIAVIGLEGWVAAERRARQPRPADDDDGESDDDDTVGYETPSDRGMIMDAHTVALAAHQAAAVTAPHAHGSVIVLAVLAAAAGLTLWAFRYMRRLVCWLIAFAAGICAIGISVWTDALVALVTTPIGVLALIVIVVASGITFHLVAVHDAQGRKIRKAKRDRKRAKKEAKRAGRAYDDEDDPGAELMLAGGKEIVIPRRSNSLDRRSHHHHIGSPAVAAIFGTSFSLLVITFGLIVSTVWQSFTSLGSTVATQSDRVNSGKATAAAVGGHGMSPGRILLIGVAILIAVLYAGHRIEKWRNGPKDDQNNGGGRGGGGGGRGGRKRRRGRNGGGGGFGGGQPTPEQMGWH